MSSSRLRRLGNKKIPMASKRRSKCTGIKFTHFLQSNGSNTGKAFSLVDGELKKKVLGNLYKCIARIHTINSPQEFAQYLDSLSPGDSLAFGIPPENTVAIRTKSELKKLKSQGIERDQDEVLLVARDRDHFSYLKDPGIMMLDYDPQDDKPALSKDNLVECIQETAPELKNSPLVWKASSSSYIYNQDTGEELTGLLGQRIYVFVDDATEIPRLGKNLFHRLWLAGYGYIRLSSSGNILPRTIVDAAVWQPERLDFAGGAFCHSPLVQHRPLAEVING